MALRPLFRALSCAATLLAGPGLGGPMAQAQPIALSVPPAEMAKTLIGAQRGAAVVGVWREGRTAFGAAGTEADAATALFEIGSISKVFTGVLLAQAVERGELRLDDTVGAVVQARAPLQGPAAALTLRQLVTHSACLPRTFAPASSWALSTVEIRTLDRATLWQRLPTVPLTGSAPCGAVYSNLGFALLGEVLSVHYGKPWEALVRERIAEPLGLRDTVQHLDAARRERLLPRFEGASPTGMWDMLAYAGAGALRSTPADLLRFGQALLAGRQGPLGAAAERVLAPLGRYGGGEIGYAVLLRGPPERRVALHDGWTGGFRSLLVLDLQGRQVLAASASNGTAAMPVFQNAVLSALFPVPSTPVPVDGASLAALAGIFRSDDGTLFRFVAQDGVLFGRGGQAGFAALVPVGQGTFTRAERGVAFSFEGADTLTARQAGSLHRARRMDSAVPPPAIPSAQDVAAVVGRYRMGDGAVFDVRHEGRQLLVRLGDQPRFPVFAQRAQPDRYVYEVVQAELQFERDSAGRATALVLHQNGVHRAPRVAD